MSDNHDTPATRNKDTSAEIPPFTVPQGNDWTFIDEGTGYIKYDSKAKVWWEYELWVDVESRTVRVYRSWAIKAFGRPLLPEAKPMTGDNFDMQKVVQWITAKLLNGDPFDTSDDNPGVRIFRFHSGDAYQVAASALHDTLECPDWCTQDSCWHLDYLDNPVHKSEDKPFEAESQEECLSAGLINMRYADGFEASENDGDVVELWLEGPRIEGVAQFTYDEFDKFLRKLNDEADRLKKMIGRASS